jgi:ABC-2 type transport system ATP-binding protein
MTPVVVADVTKRYHRRGPVVLDGVRLELQPGSITQLRGSNGSGKSTLLRLLAGVTAPTAGHIEGRPSAVGYVPERFPADLRFTPRQYLRWLGRVRGIATQELTAAVADLADVLGLSSVILDQPMRDLSKGTTQKVAVIQAMLASPSPSLLLLDEAWTGLDADAQAALTQLVLSRRGADSVVVFADHGDRAQGLRPDATYLVLDAGLTPVAPAAAENLVMRIEFAGPTGRAGELAALEGVRSTEVLSGAVAATVAAARADAVLAKALAAGWSVRSVGPA